MKFIAHLGDVELDDNAYVNISTCLAAGGLQFSLEDRIPVPSWTNHEVLNAHASSTLRNSKKPRTTLLRSLTRLAAIAAFWRSIARGVWGLVMRLNPVATGIIATNVTPDLVHKTGTNLIQSMPLQRFCEGTEVTQAVIFLDADAASSITGATLDVEVGRHVSWRGRLKFFRVSTVRWVCCHFW